MKWLRQDAKDEVIAVYQRTKNIRHTVRTTGVARNTVRAILKEEGIYLAPQKELRPVVSPASPVQVDLGFLEDIYLKSRHSSDKSDHQKYIEALLNSCKSSLGGLLDTMDLMRLEAAIAQFILYRRHFMRSLEISDKNYSGEWSRSHEKVAKAANNWMDAANTALFAWNRLLRELEMKHGVRIPDGNHHWQVNNTQVNVGVG